MPFFFFFDPVRLAGIVRLGKSPRLGSKWGLVLCVDSILDSTCEVQFLHCEDCCSVVVDTVHSFARPRVGPCLTVSAVPIWLGRVHSGLIWCSHLVRPGQLGAYLVFPFVLAGSTPGLSGVPIWSGRVNSGLIWCSYLVKLSQVGAYLVFPFGQAGSTCGFFGVPI